MRKLNQIKNTLYSYRLELDKFYNEHRDYFGWHNFSKRESFYMEQMIKRRGSDFDMKKVASVSSEEMRPLWLFYIV